MRWFTSDLHFGHLNVITYCNRPYTSVEEMNADLVIRWNKVVKQEDTVMVLGDFSLSPRWVEIITPQLNGTKILIEGNHDQTFHRKGSERHRNMITRYVASGWKEIHETLEVTLSNGTTVLCSHLPYTPKENDESNKDIRYLSKRPTNNGMVLLHGHLHGRYKKHGNMIDVGIDAHDLNLLSEDDVINLINNKESFVPSSLTEYYKTLPHRDVEN